MVSSYPRKKSFDGPLSVETSNIIPLTTSGPFTALIHIIDVAVNWSIKDIPTKAMEDVLYRLVYEGEDICWKVYLDEGGWFCWPSRLGLHGNGSVKKNLGI